MRSWLGDHSFLWTTILKSDCFLVKQAAVINLAKTASWQMGRYNS